MDRWVYDKDWTAFKVFKIPSLAGYIGRRRIKKIMYAVGMGRHSSDEVYHIMELDLKAVSDFLGKVFVTL